MQKECLFHLILSTEPLISKQNKVVNSKPTTVLNIFQKQNRPKKKQQEKRQTITKTEQET